MLEKLARETYTPAERRGICHVIGARHNTAQPTRCVPGRAQEASATTQGTAATTTARAATENKTGAGAVPESVERLPAAVLTRAAFARAGPWPLFDLYSEAAKGAG